MPVCGWLFLIQMNYEIPIALCGVCFAVATLCVDYMSDKSSFVHLNTHSIVFHHDEAQMAYISGKCSEQDVLDPSVHDVNLDAGLGLGAGYSTHSAESSARCGVGGGGVVASPPKYEVNSSGFPINNVTRGRTGSSSGSFFSFYGNDVNVSTHGSGSGSGVPALEITRMRQNSDMSSLGGSGSGSVRAGAGVGSPESGRARVNSDYSTPRGRQNSAGSNTATGGGGDQQQSASLYRKPDQNVSFIKSSGALDSGTVML